MSLLVAFCSLTYKGRRHFDLKLMMNSYCGVITFTCRLTLATLAGDEGVCGVTDNWSGVPSFFLRLLNILLANLYSMTTYAANFESDDDPDFCYRVVCLLTATDRQDVAQTDS